MLGEGRPNIGCATPLAVILSVALIVTLVLWSVDKHVKIYRVVMTAPPVEDHGYHSSLGKYRFAAVAADAPDCSRIGVDILLRHRGSAVDAAIAAMICVGVLNMQSTGVGGGHFMTIYDTQKGQNGKKVKTIIARERAPQSATTDMFVNKKGLSTYGSLSIAVPGEVKGFHEAWKMYGRVPWRYLWKPSITLCEGHVVLPNVAKAMKSLESVIRREQNLKELFVKPDGTLYKEGEYIKRPKLAETLRRISEDPYTFYNGTLADDIVKDISEQGGDITHDDLTSYTALVKEPVKTDISDTLTAFAPPAPSSGPILAFILNILRGYNFGPDDISTMDNKILTYHRIVEAFKHAYAKRSLLGDEDYVTGVKELTRNLTRADFGEAIRHLINDDHTLPNVMSYNPGFLTDFTTHGTTHLSVLAPDGSAVGITSTINTHFGSKVRGSRTGIIFNNEMDDFSTPGLINTYGLPASPSNFIKPGKRPQSSMCPTIVLDRDGRAVFVSGAAGGSRITTAVALITMETLWFGRSVLEAEDTLRFHHQLVPNVVEYHKGFPQKVLDGLKSKGHKMQEMGPISTTVAEAIHNRCPMCGRRCGRDRCIHAVTDRYKPSQPDGF